MMTTRRILLPAVLAALVPTMTAAQDPPPIPPPAWTGSAGAGLAITSGNSDTSNINISFKAVRDPKTNVIFGAEGLYMRGSNSGNLNADNATLSAKLQRSLSNRGYMFVQTQYMRDSFKAIDYFFAPTLGVGYKLVDSERGMLAADISLGPSWEKNPDLDLRAKLAVAFGEKASYVLSKSATITHGFAATLVGDDWADGLYTFNVGIAAGLTGRTQLKFEIIDTYKNKPPSVDIKKNDVSTLVSVLYKF